MSTTNIDDLLPLDAHVDSNAQMQRAYWNIQQLWGRVQDVESTIGELNSALSGDDGDISMTAILAQINTASAEAQEYAFFLMEN